MIRSHFDVIQMLGSTISISEIARRTSNTKNFVRKCEDIFNDGEILIPNKQ